MKPANQNFWLNNPEWRIFDLVYLLRGLNPPAEGQKVEHSLRDEIKRDLCDWYQWSKACPGIVPGELQPLTTPVNTVKLLNWANNLAGVKLCNWMLPLIEPSEQERPLDENEVAPLGDRERENLITTIGALAMAFADRTGAKSGDLENPNVTTIAKWCVESTGEIHGLKESTLRGRISEGIKLAKEKR